MSYIVSATTLVFRFMSIFFSILLHTETDIIHYSYVLDQVIGCFNICMTLWYSSSKPVSFRCSLDILESFLVPPINRNSSRVIYA